jgi:amino acid adenylation domain-containing protein
MAYLLHQFLARAAGRSGDANAVSDSTRTLSYSQLDRLASQVAGILGELGVRPGDRVAVQAPKSVETVACLYGIMRAGAAYVPVDPLAPDQRVAQVLGDCAPAAVVTTAAGWPATGELLERQPAILVLDGSLDGAARWADVEAQEPVASHPSNESDLAYVLYTSGSTGRPKGVMISHRNALTFVDWCVSRFEPRTDDRFASHAPFHFDLSIHDLYVSAAADAEVDLLSSDDAYFPAAVDAFIRKRGITIWYSVPTALISLTRYLAGRGAENPYPDLRLVHFAGEPYPVKELRSLRRLVPHARLFNLYGPTETNVCTYYEVIGPDLEGLDTLPIGRACENMGVFAVTEDGRLADAGEEGELWVRGPGVTAGYLNLPNETAARVVRNPFQRDFPDRAYRTGDIVVPTAGGDYLFKGRRDHQVKIRGFRIELGDIEATITAHPHVSEAAVVVSESESEQSLHAFCIRGAGGVEEGELAAWCSARLPRYMVPEQFHIEAALPRTSTGKIDRTAIRRSLEASPVPEAPHQRIGQGGDSQSLKA